MEKVTEKTFAELFGSRWEKEKGGACVSPFHLVSILAQTLSIGEILPNNPRHL